MPHNTVKVSKNPNKNWENNAIQFPRLIAELEALGVFSLGVIKGLSEEMDLTVNEICNLIDRAQSEWDAIKKQTH
jgi:hypothetical protein